MPETRSRSKAAAMNAPNGHKAHLNGSAKELTYEDGFLKGFFNRTLMPLFLMVFSPNLCILLWYTAARCDGSFMTLGEHLSSKGLVSIWLNDINIFRPVVIYTILGYMVFAVILQMTLPGPYTYGPVTPKGNTPLYTDNGFSCYLVTMFSFVVLTHCLKLYGLTPTIVYDHFGDFLGTLTVFSHVLCVFLTIKGLVAPSSSDSGSSGNPIFDYYWGTELYPRVLGVDIKVFTNCRFGMTIWPLLCLIFAIKSYEQYGFIDSMWVSCFLQMTYFTKFFWWESGYMRTIDIMVDRAGFYICWGCLCFIPGVYASVSLYMVNHPVKLGTFWSLVIVTCGSLAILINYLADWQKQEVRDTDGQCLIWGKKPEVIRAKYTVEADSKPRESLLLVSGYWGIARHFHYVPELALAFAWTVPGLFENLMLYVYFIFLFFLLTHRTFRDDIKCGLKYQKYWTEYCKRVPFKMIPGIF
ncbi:hypothetical protein CAPTEDRAFT_161831 [Capitella teleta]|uniref:7-dehydrocholesterol reductase n=1 Tax=Capitella teleta TaxID=283909 RepID=R7V4P9_CAPTE|nr:hypothetical protein CAPTEDRAFT_161831 [Capitella teleta]|eukprot:ELU11336.1 hypothetical protein CAPTEDRAFT_161831 [Capitella teleta]